MLAYRPDLHPIREVTMFGDVVRQRRLERGWTQQQLAELVGVTTP
jgi:plasmid maintenance system antidote protein VapI